MRARPDAPMRRARPLSLEERRSSIIEAIIPLLVVHGRELTSKQIAEAAGVAEGTVFRAFGDKDRLIAAAIERFLDPRPMLRELQAIDPGLELQGKILAIIMIVQKRFSEVFRVMAVVGHHHPPHPDHRTMFAETIAGVLGPHLGELGWHPERVAHLIRLLTFAASLPHLSHGPEFTPAELASIILHGVAGAAPDQESQV